VILLTLDLAAGDEKGPAQQMSCLFYVHSQMGPVHSSPSIPFPCPALLSYALDLTY
jgi:hypothetical protein